MKITDNTFFKQFSFQYTTQKGREAGTLIFSIILRENKAWEFHIILR